MQQPKLTFLKFAPLLFCLACQSTNSGSTSHTASASPKLAYLSSEDVNLQSLLPPPPADSSAQAQKDLAQVLQMQTARSEADCARTRVEMKENLSAFFGPPYGPLTSAEVLTYNDFVEKVWQESTYFARKAKSVYPRKRPYQAHDQEVHPCDGVEHTKSNSYPSGHALESMLAAETLSAIDPTRKPIFLMRAAQIAGDRVLTGMHYPSDIEAGAKLAEDIFAVLKTSPEFQKDLQAVRKTQAQ